MKFFIGGSIILFGIVNYPLDKVVMGIETIIVLLFIYLIISAIRIKGNN